MTQRPSGIAFDTVGDAAQAEHAVGKRDLDLAPDLGGDRDNRAAPLGVPAREPMRDAQETRPPECSRLGKFIKRGEVRFAERDQFAHRIGGKAGREILREMRRRRRE